jgi:hypothetical protein
VPADSLRFYAPGKGDFLLQEDGVRIGRRMREVALDFLVGRTVEEVRDEGRIVFETGAEPLPRLSADVGPALCVDGDGRPQSLTGLVGHVVESASSHGGALVLVFRDGATLRCDPSPEYEAWQVEGGRPHSFIVCCPGGELAVWDDTPPIPHSALRERDPDTATALDELFEQYNLPRPGAFPPP